MEPLLAEVEKVSIRNQSHLCYLNLEASLFPRVLCTHRISMGEYKAFFFFSKSWPLLLTDRLFRIEEVDEDSISPDSKSPGTVISNLDQLQDSRIKFSIQHQTPLKRGVRYSLTFRDVERVSTINTFTRR